MPFLRYVSRQKAVLGGPPKLCAMGSAELPPGSCLLCGHSHDSAWCFAGSWGPGFCLLCCETHGREGTTHYTIAVHLGRILGCPTCHKSASLWCPRCLIGQNTVIEVFQGGNILFYAACFCLWYSNTSFVRENLRCLNLVTTDILGQEGKHVVYLQSKNSGYRCALGNRISYVESNYWQINEFHIFFPLWVTKYVMLRLYLANKITYNILMPAPV